MFEELTLQIEKDLTEKPNVIVAITGFAGSGKSTLASKLANYFNISDDQILRIDNLYVPKPRGKGLFGAYDWGLLKRILSDAHKGEGLKYQSRSFEDEISFVDVPLPKVIILEGIQLFREELMGYYDISVWIDCPIELALRRAKARDISQGHSEQYMKRWDTEWGPESVRYFSEHHPNMLASFIYNDYK